MKNKVIACIIVALISSNVYAADVISRIQYSNIVGYSPDMNHSISTAMLKRLRSRIIKLIL